MIKLADYLARDGHAVTLVAFTVGKACRELLPRGISLMQIGRPWLWSGSHFRDAALEYLMSPLLSRQVPRDAEAAVFFGTPTLPALFFLSMSRFRGKIAYFCYEPPRVLYADLADIAGRLGMGSPLFLAASGLLRSLDRLAVKQVPIVLTNSHYNKHKLRAIYGVEATVVTHGVDLPVPRHANVQALRSRLEIAPEAPIILTVNHLHPRKRVDLFLRVLHGLRTIIPSAVGVVVGNGIERARLELVASALGLTGAVKFVGWVPESDLATYYGLASVYLHTAREESFGLSIIEAMAAGVPVVAVAEGGPTETIIDGVTGLLASATSEELVQKVAYLLASPDRAARMGAQAREHVISKYSWGHAVNDLLTALSEDHR